MVRLSPTNCCSCCGCGWDWGCVWTAAGCTCCWGAECGSVDAIGPCWEVSCVLVERCSWLSIWSPLWHSLVWWWREESSTWSYWSRGKDTAFIALWDRLAGPIWEGHWLAEGLIWLADEFGEAEWLASILKWLTDEFDEAEWFKSLIDEFAEGTLGSECDELDLEYFVGWLWRFLWAWEGG